MTPAAPALRAAVITALTTGAGAAALDALGVDTSGEGVTSAPYDDQPPPFVEIQGVTESEGERSDATRSTDATVTVVARAATLTAAESIASAVVEHVGLRLSVSGFDVTATTLDLYGPAFQEPPPGARPWSLPVRVRSTLFQTATASE